MGEFLGRQSIGSYTLIDPIASGGMGVVYRAQHRRLQRVVALKILFPQFASDEEFVARFSREAQALAALEHPNIVRIFDADVDNGLYYLAMEYAERGTLQRELNTLCNAGQKMPVARVVGIVQQIAGALDFAHDRGFVHRDIKPSNILIGKDGHYRLSDFGLALDENKSKLTRMAATLGTPEYMSPEQARGDAVDKRSDIYSLGIVAYEMLAGAPPFTGSSALSVLNKQLLERPLPLVNFRADVPADIVNAVNVALSKEPQLRQRRASDVFGQNAPTPVVVETDTRTSTSASVRGNRKHNCLLPIAIVLAAIVVLSGSIVWITLASNPRGRSTTSAVGTQVNASAAQKALPSTPTLIAAVSQPTEANLAPTSSPAATMQSANTRTSTLLVTVTPVLARTRVAITRTPLVRATQTPLVASAPSTLLPTPTAGQTQRNEQTNPPSEPLQDNSNPNPPDDGSSIMVTVSPTDATPILTATVPLTDVVVTPSVEITPAIAPDLPVQPTDAPPLATEAPPANEPALPTAAPPLNESPAEPAPAPPANDNPNPNP
jgi:serine/threonine protein kinase